MPSPIREIMNTPLPSLAEQRKKSFRPTLRETRRTFRMINEHIFNNELNIPTITLKRTRMYWGMCIGQHKPHSTGSRCVIELSDKWFCVQWFVTCLAHEMIHQYEWDVLDKNMTHRGSFFMWRKKLKQHGIHLKTAHRYRRWFKYQDFTRC